MIQNPLSTNGTRYGPVAMTLAVDDETDGSAYLSASRSLPEADSYMAIKCHGETVIRKGD